MNTWKSTTISTDHTHHVLDDHPLYECRFKCVLKFHEPGLASAEDESGAFHILPDGRAAYERRFEKAFGFYENHAAVTVMSGWWHILPDGRDLYSGRYSWCGNFQESRCPVRAADASYFHIDPDGAPAYRDKHLYAGDFRDGIACVRFASDGLYRHVRPDGRLVHNRAWSDLDVFHKGLARARDEGGWCHVGMDGRGVYAVRFAAVEPFYNGQALCETLEGDCVIVGEEGQVLHVVWRAGG